MNTPFYSALAAAKPDLRMLSLEDDTLDDACCAALSALRLESLNISDSDQLSGALVDGILAGPCATTLRDVGLYYVAGIDSESPLRGADVLRLIRGCPRLTRLDWFVHHDDEDMTMTQPKQAAFCLDRATLAAIESLLESRGARIDRSLDQYKFWGSDGMMRTGGNVLVFCKR